MTEKATDNRHVLNREGLLAGIRRLAVLVFPLLVATSLSHAQVESPTVGAQAQTTRSADEPTAAIRSAAQSFVKGLLTPSSGETTVTAAILDPRLRLARCASAPTAALPAGMNLQARVTVGVTCAGPVRWTVYVPVTLESKIDVLVLRHAVARDSHLSAADVTVETRKTAGPGTAYLSSVAELSGRTARRALAAGTTLAVEMLTPDLIVHRGQTVTLLSSGSAIEVRASGRAMMDAAAGTRIQVQNLSSMRIVEGVVESADLVRVAR